MTSTQGRPNATFKKLTNGQGTITANIVFPNATTPYAISKTVSVGTPARPHLHTSPTTSTSAIVTYTLYYGSTTTTKQIQFVVPSGTATPSSYTLTKTANPSNFSLAQNGTEVIVTPLALGAGQFTIRPNNSCGQGEVVTVNLDIQQKTGGGPGIELPKLPIDFSVYPNPTSGIITVELNNIQQSRGDGDAEEVSLFSAQSEKTPYEGNYTLQLWNEFGLVKTENCDTPVSQISLQSLPAGIYYLHIIIEGNVVSRQIVRKTE